MTEMLFITVLTQILLILGGYGLIQVLVWNQRIRFLLLLPFYWGSGVLLIYLGGHFFALTDVLHQQWHWIIAAICIILFVLGLWRRQHLNEDNPEQRIQWQWFHYLFIVLIASKIMLVGFINIHNPVIDSDATYLTYVPMSQKIGAGFSRTSVIAEHGNWNRVMTGSLGPALLAAYPRLFIERWHNHAVSIPWLFCYLSILTAVLVFAWRLTGNMTVSLGMTYLFSAVPIIANHTIRPGFHGLLVCYFLIMAIGAAAVFIKENGFEKLKLRFEWVPVLILVGSIGAFLSKPEGKLWSIWLGVILISYAINVRKGIAWSKIIGAQFLLAFAGMAIWYIFGDQWFAGETGRIKQLAPAAFNPTAWNMTGAFIFTWGTFNVLWWVSVIAGVVVLVYAELRDRVFVFYLFTMVAFLIFFANLTQNSVYTIQGTTLGRFLHHIMAVPLLTIIFAVNILQKKKLLPITR